MSYCSIQEAWGDNFSKPTKPKKKKKKRIILEGDDYTRVTIPKNRRSKMPKQYQHTDVYDTHNYYNENSNINTNMEPYYETNEFSRGVTRLPNHNGPETRSMLQDIHYPQNEKSDYIGYSPKDILNYESVRLQNQKKKQDIYECPQSDHLYDTGDDTDMESDADADDLKMSQEMVDRGEHDDIGSEIKEEYSNFNDLSNRLKEYNDNQNNQDNQDNQNKNNQDNQVNLNNGGQLVSHSDNMYDLVLYMFTGVFYLVLCDFIYKLGRKTY